MTTHQQDLVSWLAFPEVPQWSSFAPQLIFRLSGAQPCMEAGEQIRLYETDSLVQAVSILSRARRSPLLYLAAPQGAERGRRVSHELAVSITRPQYEKSRKFRKPSGTALWCPGQEGHAYFGLRKNSAMRGLELVVGGESEDECHRIWEVVGAWIRRLYVLAHPHCGLRSTIQFPLLKDVLQLDTKQALYAKVRKAVLSAEQMERQASPFLITGVGYEPRVSLDRYVAVALRMSGLHRYTTRGRCPQSYYPKRVFVRAAGMLERVYRQPVLRVTSTGGRTGRVTFI